MKKYCLIWSVCLILFLSVFTAPTFAQDIDGRIEVSGLERFYHVHLPASYIEGKDYALVIVLHGAGGQGTQMAAYSGFNRLADKENFIAVYPDGYRRLWNVGLAGPAAEGRGVDDLGFIGQMLDQLMRDYSIDAKRVYVTGMSMGGMMSHRLAVEMPGRIAAIAPVSGTLTEAVAAHAAPEPMPVLIMHGTSDPIVPYQGGPVGMQRKTASSVLSVQNTALYWAKQNNCQLNPIIEKTIDQVPDDQTKVVVSRYRSSFGQDVWIYSIEGGGHAWPRTGAENGERSEGIRERFAAIRLGRSREGSAREGILGTVSHEFDAAEVIWQFFKPLRRN